MLVGIASGTYSSIFIASPVLTAWKEREPGFVRRRQRIAEVEGGTVPAFADDIEMAKLGGRRDRSEAPTARPRSRQREPQPGAVATVEPSGRRRRQRRRARSATASRRSRRGLGRARARSATRERRAPQASRASTEGTAEDLMALLVWFTMGIALWHFTVFLPDRFWQGIVGAFLGAVAGAVVFGADRPGGQRQRPRRHRSRRPR